MIMRASLWIIAVSACALLIIRDGHAQELSAGIEARIGLTGDTRTQIGELEGILASNRRVTLRRQPSGIPQGVIVNSERRTAERAAEVDPGMIIKADPRIDAMIVEIRPTVDVDPEMILPEPIPGIKAPGQTP
jgi:hypothetical protein